MTTITVPRAVLEQALEALEQCGLGDTHRSYEFEHAARAALRAALAQQAEPVEEPAFHGFMSDDGTQVDVCFSPSAPRKDGTYATAYYTAPPQRKLVPLTEEEILAAVGWERAAMYMKLTPNFPVDEAKKETLTNARAVEKAVWEKNHGQA